jgi:hypothetical protein
MCESERGCGHGTSYLVIVFNIQGFLVRSLLIDTKTCRSPHFEKFGPPFEQSQHKAQHYGKILKN